MNEIVATIGLLMHALAAVSIFTILFVTISKTLKQTPMFNGGGTWVIALAVSLLCMIGLYRTFVGPAAGGTATEGHTQPWIEFCLLPYTALALALLSVLLLIFLHKLRNGRPRRGLRHAKITRSEYPASRGSCRELRHKPFEPKKKSCHPLTNKEIKR